MLARGVGVLGPCLPVTTTVIVSVVRGAPSSRGPATIAVTSTPVVASVISTALHVAEAAEPCGDGVQTGPLAGVVADASGGGREGLDGVICAEACLVGGGRGLLDLGRDAGAVGVVEGPAADGAGGQELGVGERGDGGYGLLYLRCEGVFVSEAGAGRR